MTAVVATGLTAGEARQRLETDGPNELPQAEKRSPLKIAIGVLREPMLALLLVGGSLYLVLGNLGEALILLGFAMFSVVVTIVQETRTEGVLDALRDLSAPRALVVRDGTRVRIAGREVVRDDVVILEQGDRIPADATLLDAQDLEVDESLLTGESMPVGKSFDATDDAAKTVYSGSLVTRGSGTARATAIASATEIGKIGQSIAKLEVEPPRLRAETARIVRWCAIGGGAVAVLVVLLYGLTRGGWVDALLAGIAIGMSMLPEEFPVVLTIFLAMGAWRIGQAGVLTRRAAAIETLGSATILCTDKTGTLTENRMAVAQVWLPSGEMLQLDPATPARSEVVAVLEAALLASAADPVDPMEIAIDAAAAALPPQRRAEIDSWTLAHAYGLQPDLLAMSNVWQRGDADYLITAKGAPEAIASLCALEDKALADMSAAVEQLANDGIRVLGVATATTNDTTWPATQTAFHYAFVGLIGLADPLRPSARGAVAECRAAGIRVVMITGDHGATAQAIALDAGIEAGDVLTGPDLAALDDVTLTQRLPGTSVFARITPDQKLRIVEAYKAAGHVVAMTGDGVNDAPSLKAAHIGIAMGKRGTDVAREAAAIVLLDDDFGSIAKAIGLGRRIYDNIRKAMAFIFAVHVPIAGLALLPLIFGLPILLGPVHIALIEMIIDPVCALVFEAEREEADVMQRPPRDPNEQLFSLPMIVGSLTQGLLAFGLLAAIFFIENAGERPDDEVRALVFFALIASIVALILVNRSATASLAQAFTRRNVALRYVFAVVLAVGLVIQFVPAVGGLLKFGSLGWFDLPIVLGTGVVLFLTLEIVKRFTNFGAKPTVATPAAP